MEDLKIKKLSVSGIVHESPGAIRVFEKYGIDYCFYGSLGFAEACAKAEAEEELVLDELREVATGSRATLIRANDWPLDLLASYIIHNHHKYVRKVTHEIMFLTSKVETAHGAFHPELRRIREQFERLTEDLELHMQKEEVILFPAIGRLGHHQHGHAAGAGEDFPLTAPLAVMEAEHETACRYMRDIRSLCNDYALPSEACNAYELLFIRLQEFELDLQTHIHLENNILFPKALLMNCTRAFHLEAFSE